MSAPPRAPGGLYAGVRALARFWVWFFFKAVDVRHPERIPAEGPALLCINHPNNLIDSLLVGAVVSRRVHFLATAALFRNALVRRFLLACGAIPVYRKQDDPDKMDRNVDAFAACYGALERGGLVAIYPEGTTHAEPRVQRIKTGAARIALEYEARRAGPAGGAPPPLQVLPVGLTFEARKSFRARVLVSFGEPLAVAPYARQYAEDPVKAVDALTTAVQYAMEAEVVSVKRMDSAAFVRAVQDLYRSELVRELEEERGLSPRQIDQFRLSRAIADATAHFEERDPERVERIWQHILSYRALLADYRVRDEAVRARLRPLGALQRVRLGRDAALGFPVFAYGVLVNGLAYYPPRWLAHRMSRKETDYATTRFLLSIVALPIVWAVETWLVARVAGVAWALPFFVSLPLSGLVAYRYLGGAGLLGAHLRLGALSLTRHQVASRLLAERQAIMAELDRARNDYLASRGGTF